MSVLAEISASFGRSSSVGAWGQAQLGFMPNLQACSRDERGCRACHKRVVYLRTTAILVASSGGSALIRTGDGTMRRGILVSPQSADAGSCSSAGIGVRGSMYIQKLVALPSGTTRDRTLTTSMGRRIRQVRPRFRRSPRGIAAPRLLAFPFVFVVGRAPSLRGPCLRTVGLRAGHFLCRDRSEPFCRRPTSQPHVGTAFAGTGECGAELSTKLSAKCGHRLGVPDVRARLRPELG